MKSMKRILILTAVVMMAVSAFAAAADEQAGPDIKYKVNLVMDDGTVIFYAGSKLGVKAGDEYALYRGGQQVGTVKVSRVTDLAAYCKITSGDAKEMDGLAQTKTGAAVSSAPKKAEKTPEEIAEEKAKKDEEAKKKKEAAEKKKQEDADKKRKQEEAEKEKSAPDATAKKQPAEKKQAPKYPPIEEPTFAAPTYFGTAGLLYMPTAQVVPGKANAYINNVKTDNYTDRGYGLGVSLNNMFEISYTKITTKMDNSSYWVPWGTINVGVKTDVISAKYAPPARGSKNQNAPVHNIKMPGTKKGGGTNAGTIQYAAGITHYKITLTANTLGFSYLNASETATRYYAVASTDYNNMKAHAAIYTQGGDLLTGTSDDGIGFMAGVEYPLGGMGGGAMSALSLIAEYDHKAFYLMTDRTPSLGLRYNGGPYSVTLGMMDVTQEKILSFGGSYGF